MKPLILVLLTTLILTLSVSVNADEEAVPWGYYVIVHTTDDQSFSKLFRDKDEATQYFLDIKELVGLDAMQLVAFNVVWEDNTITEVNHKLIGVLPLEDLL